MNELLKQPLVTRENTVHGKKDKYGEIVAVWKQYEGPVQGWVLLALVDTMEQMSKMIYEYYHELKELFKEMLEEYRKDEGAWDAKGGLAVLKACQLDVISAERYAKEGLRMVREYGKAEQELEEAARQQWEIIRQTWGMDDEF